MGNPFAEDTSVEQVGEGRYRGFLSPRWNLRPHPQGGIVTAVALRAMEALAYRELRDFIADHARGR